MVVAVTVERTTMVVEAVGKVAALSQGGGGAG
jgi:hypothetical protein